MSRPSQSLRPFDIAFLDRDGTLNVRRPGYVSRPEDLELVPGATQAVRLLNDSGVRVVLVTNQRGLALGRLTGAELAAVHEALVRRLAAEGAWLDAIHVCGHAARSCSCRKPEPGMLLQEFADSPWARPARCIMFGDSPSDVEAASRAGVRGVLVGDEGTRLIDAVTQALTGA